MVDVRPLVDREAGILNPLPPAYNIGAMDAICQHCQARHFRSERIQGHFSSCCNNGLVALDADRTLQQPPETLMALLIDDGAADRHFRQEIRRYNSVLAFASFTVNAQANRENPHQQHELAGRGPRVFTVFGQMYHQMSNQAVSADGRPRYCQMYFVDSETANRERLRPRDRQTPLLQRIIHDLDGLLRDVNPYAQAFR